MPFYTVQEYREGSILCELYAGEYNTKDLIVINLLKIDKSKL